ncbi:hypothetical protein [Acetobacter conturbans]|uniref:Uncharacterized protein n=1 Tax=Acetobacter conturbans TaxID=1737472 RepID=A0ABX0K4T6_9PROT|nr:hypothetical protein [Acetobacter conturbans]NHN89668.1 hypothetical protein [Acetobacter conturbans]
MSAFSRLWRRAPVWRLSLFGMVAFSGLTVLYPPHWLVKLYPPIGTLVHHPAASADSGGDTPSSSEEQDTDASQGAAPPPPPAGRAPQQTAAAGGDNGHRGDYTTSSKAAAPPIDAELRDIIPIAGRQLPLPAGVWHPVLTEESGPHGEISSNILVRTDRGVVTGVILVRATTASVPAKEASNLEPFCPKDRSVSRHLLAAPSGATQCAATGVGFMPHDEKASRDDIDWAFHRLNLLGFPMPPLMGLGLWVYEANAADGGKDFEVVSIALSPAEPGTAKLSTPLADWTPEGLGNSPFSGRFMNNLHNWLLQWAPILLQGYQGKLQPVASGTIRPGAADPAWHGSADMPPT